jgi:hypothetical protein
VKRLIWAALVAGCGVPGKPLPPGPVPPAAPAQVRILSVPDGIEVHAQRPTVDIDGAPLKKAPALLLFVNDPQCHGRPVRRADSGPLSWAEKPAHPLVLRVTAAIADRRGPPAAPVEFRWQTPPPAPPPPVGFGTPDGAVQIAWLPPEPPVTEIVVLRDGKPLATVPAQSGQYVDRAAKGPHLYSLAAQTPSARSAPSATVQIRP